MGKIKIYINKKAGYSANSTQGAGKKNLFNPALAVSITICMLLPFCVFLLFPDAAALLQYFINDLFFQLRYTLQSTAPVYPYLIHIDINRTAHNTLQFNTWDREMHGELINILAHTKAKALFPDFLFTENNSPPGADENNAKLVQAVRQAGNVYLPVVLLPVTGSHLSTRQEFNREQETIISTQMWHPRILKEGLPLQTAFLDLPFPALALEARGLGHTTAEPDQDGVHRQFPLVFKYREGYIPSIALCIVCDYLQVNPRNIEITFGKQILLKNAVFPSGLNEDIAIPIDASGRMRINFTGPWGTSFSHFDVEKILEAKKNPVLADALENEMDDFIIFISDTGPESARYYKSVYNGFYPSIYLHSQVANTILTGNFIHTPHLLFKTGCILLLIVIIYLCAVRFRELRYSISILLCGLITTAASVVFFLYLRMLPFLVEPGTGLLLSLIIVNTYKFILKEKETIRYRTRLEESRKIEGMNKLLQTQQATLEKAHAQLKELDSFKTHFFQNLTHEFRTPLTLISGPLDSILTGHSTQLPDFIKQQLGGVLMNSRRLSTLIDQLLELSRIDNTGIKRQFRPVKISAFLEACIAPFRLLAEKRGITLQWEALDSTVSLYVDYAKMERVICNLISNAFKFVNRGGSMKIQCSAPFCPETPLLAGENRSIGQVVEIRFQDTGAGIPAAFLPRIFERFYQVPGTTAGQGGTGIGLALVKEYVKLHYGAIRVESSIGQGTCFIITLPWGSSHLLPEEVTAEEIPDQHEAGAPAPIKQVSADPGFSPDRLLPDTQDAGESTPLPVKYYRILVVEDDPAMAAFIQSILQEEYHIFLACEGRAALSRIEEIAPHLLITDLVMPVMNGPELIREVRQNANCAHIPVILITARSGFEIKKPEPAARPDEYLSKPFHPAELKARVKSMLILSLQEQTLEAFQKEQHFTNPVKLRETKHTLEKNPELPILIVDDDEEVLITYRTILGDNGFTHLILLNDSRQVMGVLEAQAVSLVLLDLAMPHMSGQDVLARISEKHPHIPVIILTGYKTIDTAVNCMRLGAFDYQVKPVDLHRLCRTLSHALEISRLESEVSVLKNKMLTGELKNPRAFAEIITNSGKMKTLFLYTEAIAASPWPVLITGESGTGKELIAGAIHRLSGRTGKFVTVNIAGLEYLLFSDTLFGHRKGAYTGADEERKGLIEQAELGTLFLDEIGDLEIASQVKLLRLLQEGEYFPLGADIPRVSGARVIVATNQNLMEKQKQEKFRTDLYYRLLTHHIELPPLRERLADDLPLLVDHFLEQAAHSLSKKKPAVPRELIPLLATYTFPGNIRELQSMIFDAVSRHTSRMLSLNYFKAYLEKARGNLHPAISPRQAGTPITYGNLLPTLQEAEEFFIREALEKAGGNISIAAQLLGVARSTLSRKLQKKHKSQ